MLKVTLFLSVDESILAEDKQMTLSLMRADIQLTAVAVCITSFNATVHRVQKDN